MPAFVRFDEAFLQRLRDTVDLPSLIGRELKLIPAGPQSFKASCPFHAESTPSFFVKRDGFYRCYGCSKTGDAIEWMKQRYGMTFHEAALSLARDSGIEAPPPQELPAEAQQALQGQARLRRVLEEAARIYRRGLARNTLASRYLLEQRGITSNTAADFELGAVGYGVVRLLSRHSRQHLLDSGLAIAAEDGALNDRFSNRIMFPIRNQHGALVSFAGRTFLPDDRRDSKYLNGPETELFRKGDELFGLNLAHREVRRSRTAIVVEGYFDVVTLHGVGERRAVAPMGTAMTGRQLAALLRLADHVYFAFDGDEAGRKAARASARLALEMIRDGQTAYFITLPDGQDPDLFARTHGVDGWHSAMSEANPLSRFVINEVLEGLDLRIAEMRVTAVRRAVEFINCIAAAPVFRQSLRMSLEDAVGISLE